MSFAEASADLQALAEIEISATHLQQLSERIGDEWVEFRDEDVKKFRQGKLERLYKKLRHCWAVAVMLDGGRVQTRAEESGRGVSGEGWNEFKLACCLTLQTTVHDTDPHPEPPSKFLEPATAARLVSEIKRRSCPATERSSKQQNSSRKKGSQEKKQEKKKQAKKKQEKKKRKKPRSVCCCRACGRLSIHWHASVRPRQLERKLSKRR